MFCAGADKVYCVVRSALRRLQRAAPWMLPSWPEPTEAEFVATLPTVLRAPAKRIGVKRLFSQFSSDAAVRRLYDEATRDYANFIVLPLCVAIARRREPAFLAHRAKMLPKVLSNAPGLDSLALHWGTPPLVCESMCVSMASVFLPTDRLLSLVPAGPGGAINYRLKKLKTFVHDYLWNTHAVEVPCYGDVNGNGVVDVEDLVEVILAWGTDDAAADITGDGIVNVEDLVEIILAWGSC